MYVSIQTVCSCHGYLVFESIHCDRCRSLIPYQISDDSLVTPISKQKGINGTTSNSTSIDKHTTVLAVQYEKKAEKKITTGHVRFRTFCPFCNNSIYILRYYCKRERIYHQMRISNFGDNEQTVYTTIAETQQLSKSSGITSKLNRTASPAAESNDDSISLTGSFSQGSPSTILYDQSGLPSTRDIQIENERNLYALKNLEGDLFYILRSGLYYDTLILCQDNIKLQAHRCILGGRSRWFRNLLNEYHDTETHDDYVLQISIDDISSGVMNEILNFIYTNRCLISLKNAPELLIAAKRFELERLKKQIAEFLLSRLTLENAIEMLVCAHEAGSNTLKTACIRLINRHAERIKRTEKWKIFKTEYVDLVPELYEHRVEKPTSAPLAILPDVYPPSTVPAENLAILNEIYENPVKQRLPSPVPRILPAPTKHRTGILTNSVHAQLVENSREDHETRDNRPTKDTKTIKDTKPTTNTARTKNQSKALVPVAQDKPTTKKQTTNNSNPTTNTKSRTAPIVAPPGPTPLTRNVFATLHESPDIDIYRRPVNIDERSVGPYSTARSPSTKTNQSHTARQQSPLKQAVQRHYHQPTEKVVRTISPDQFIEFERSPSENSLQQEDQTRLGRVVSVDRME